MVFWRENDIDINKSKILLFSCCAVQLLCIVELNTGTKLLGFRVKIRVRIRVRFRIRLGLGSEQQVRMKLGLQAD